MHKFLYPYIIAGLFALTGCEEKLFTERSDDPQYAFDVLWQEVDRHYSFFDRAPVDWESVYAMHRHRVTPSTTNDELFAIMDEVLTLLNDAHVNIYAPIGTGGNSNYFSAYPLNPVVAQPDGSYFDYYINDRKRFGYGKLKNSTVAYLRIKTFEGTKDDFEEIDDVLEELSWSSGLIIDVRSNFGGNIINSEVVASHFAETTQVAYEYRLRNGPRHTDFTEWYPVNLVADESQFYRDKPVVVLTNRSSFSATEWFVLFMKLQSRVTVVGDTTGGGGAVPITRELPNGWIVRISNTQTRLTTGEIFQGRGIYPDIAVWIKKEDEENNIDTILEAAMAIIP